MGNRKGMDFFSFVIKMGKKKKPEKDDKKTKDPGEEKNHAITLLLIAAFLLIPMSQNSSATLCRLEALG